MSKNKKRSIDTGGGELRKINVPFTQVANSVLNDPKITLKAKGLFAYIYSKPHGWEFSSKRMANDSKDGRDSVRSAIAELETAGYLTRKKLSSGRVRYSITYKKTSDDEEKEEADNTGF